MKKDLIFTPVMLAVGIALFLLRFTGMPVHIAVSVVGLLVLVAFTAATKKEWKLPALEIVMRACYGVALISGPVIMKFNDIDALKIAHKASSALFVLLLVVLFVHKLVTIKASKN